MLVEEYLIESKKFNEQLNDNKKLKSSFFFCKKVEHVLFFIAYAIFVCFSFKVLNDFYNINEIFSVIGIPVFFMIYFFIIKYRGILIKTSPHDEYFGIFFVFFSYFFWLFLWFFIEPPFEVDLPYIIFRGIVSITPLLVFILIYLEQKFISCHYSYSLIEKRENDMTIQQNKIEEMKKSILENENHKKETIDYLLDRKNNNKELSFEEIELKDTILKNEGISVHKDFFILECIIKENNRKKEVYIENT